MKNINELLERAIRLACLSDRCTQVRSYAPQAGRFTGEDEAYLPSAN